MASQMSNFWDQAGSIWAQGQLTGKVGSVMSSTATQHGGQETTLFSGITNLMHFGMIIVGLPYAYQGQMTLDEIVGGSPYGATTIAGGQGQRQPSQNELEAARFQGRLVAETAAKLTGGALDDCATRRQPTQFRRACTTRLKHGPGLRITSRCLAQRPATASLQPNPEEAP
jgi:NAD(P)H dehydrogenase (quinone)